MTPELEAASLYSIRRSLVLTMLSSIPVMSLMAGGMLLILASIPWPGLSEVEGMCVFVGLLLSGGIALAYGGIVAFVNVDYLKHRRKFRWVRDIIAQRKESIVSPQDRRTVFVEVMPRDCWENQDKKHPKDSGLLVIENSSGELRLEGLKHRYRIPASSIVSCDVVNTTPDADRKSYFATVLRTQAVSPDAGSNGRPAILEIPLLVRPVKFGRDNATTRKFACEALWKEIQSMKALAT